MEDDPQVARLIALVLHRNGYTSKVVADGQSALAAAQSEKPSMIFADLTIKGMRGDQLCAMLKQQPGTKDIPYIVLSGDRDIAEKARICGADDY
ncbi:MAG TPA: response regulator, partial [Thermoanaerobaculia bacterium]|nr:response regulator [Thermoanaerobaculia bacterium]